MDDAWQKQFFIEGLAFIKRLRANEKKDEEPPAQRRRVVKAEVQEQGPPPPPLNGPGTAANNAIFVSSDEDDDDSEEEETHVLSVQEGNVFTYGPDHVFDSEAEMLEAKANYQPLPGQPAAESMHWRYTGSQVRSRKLDDIKANAHPAVLLSQLLCAQRPDVKTDQVKAAMLAKAKYLMKKVTGKDECENVDWLKNVDEVMAAIPDNKYGSKKQYTDVIIALYFAVNEPCAAQQKFYFDTHYQFCDWARDEFVNAAEKKTIPEEKHFLLADQRSSGQNRVLIRFVTQFAGRNQNYVANNLIRLRDGKLINPRTKQEVPTHTDTYPLQGNAMIKVLNEDGSHFYEYFQSHYKTSETYGRQVGRCNNSLTDALDAEDYNFEARISLFENSSGGVITEDSARTMVTRIFEQAGLSGVTPGLVRKGLCQLPQYRKAFVLLRDSATTFNHSLSQHFGPYYVGGAHSV